MHLRAKNEVAIILYFGAKNRQMAEIGVKIDDPDSFLKWLAKDRAMIIFRDSQEIAGKKTAFTQIINQWIEYL